MSDEDSDYDFDERYSDDEFEESLASGSVSASPRASIGDASLSSSPRVSPRASPRMSPRLSPRSDGDVSTLPAPPSVVPLLPSNAPHDTESELEPEPETKSETDPAPVNMKESVGESVGVDVRDDIARMARKTSVFGLVRTFESLLEDTGTSADELTPSEDIGAPTIQNHESSASSSKRADVKVEARGNGASESSVRESARVLDPDTATSKVGKQQRATLERRPRPRNNPHSNVDANTYVRRRRSLRRRFVQPVSRRARASPAAAKTPDAFLSSSAQSALQWLHETSVPGSSRGSIRKANSARLKSKLAGRVGLNELVEERALRGSDAEHWYSDSDIVECVLDRVLHDESNTMQRRPSHENMKSRRKTTGGTHWIRRKKKDFPEDDDDENDFMTIDGSNAIAASAKGEKVEEEEDFERCFFKFMRHVADFAIDCAASDGPDFEMRKKIYAAARNLLLNPKHLKTLKGTCCS